MRFSDVLGFSTSKNGNWENGSNLPKGDFRQILEALPENTDGDNYERFVFELIYQHQQIESNPILTNYSYFLATILRTHPQQKLKIKEHRAIYEVQGKITEKGFKLGSIYGFQEPITFKRLNSNTIEFNQVSSLLKKLSTLELPKSYQKSGLLGFVLNCLFWGRECAFANPEAEIGLGFNLFTDLIEFQLAEEDKLDKNSDLICLFQFKYIQ